MRRPAALLVALLLAWPASAAAAPEPRASLPDIEDEVMCTICGTLLELAENSQADRERAFIRDLIAQGKTKSQIKAALVEEYGEDVLATPGDSGFDLAAWIVPILAAGAGVLGVGIAVRRWRGSAPAPEAAPPEPAAPDAQRLDADLARYDL